MTIRLLLKGCFLTFLVGIQFVGTSSSFAKTSNKSKNLVKTEDAAVVSPELKLEDLGITPEQQKADMERQDTLNTRSSMLQTHQVLGLVTLGLMTATYFTAREHQEASRLHQVLGYTTAASYLTTAYFSLMAPEVEEGFSAAGWSMKIHKALLFVHLPGMILTPIAGYLSSLAYRHGKEPTGLAKYKSTLANVTYFSFAAAALSVTINF